MFRMVKSAMIGLLMLMAGCSSGEAEIVSTPTPDISLPAGVRQNPLQMVYVPADFDAVQPNVAALESALLEEVRLYIDLIPAQSYAQALADLCATSGNAIRVAWLDGLGYAAAEARNCGTAVLRAIDADADDLRDGLPGAVVLNSDLGTDSLTALSGRTFCRLTPDDLYSWVVPSLLMRQNGVNPDSIGAVQTYDDTAALLDAVRSGACAGAGVPVTAMNGSASNDEAAASQPASDDVTIAETSVPLPYAVLMLPPEMPAAPGLALTEALIEIADTQDLAPFLGVGDIVRVETGDFADLNAFLTASGLDFAQLGD